MCQFICILQKKFSNVVWENELDYNELLNSYLIF